MTTQTPSIVEIANAVSDPQRVSLVDAIGKTIETIDSETLYSRDVFKDDISVDFQLVRFTDGTYTLIGESTVECYSEFTEVSPWD